MERVEARGVLRNRRAGRGFLFADARGNSLGNASTRVLMCVTRVCVCAADVQMYVRTYVLAHLPTRLDTTWLYARARARSCTRGRGIHNACAAAHVVSAAQLDMRVRKSRASVNSCASSRDFGDLPRDFPFSRRTFALVLARASVLRSPRFLPLSREPPKGCSCDETLYPPSGIFKPGFFVVSWKKEKNRSRYQD